MNLEDQQDHIRDTIEVRRKQLNDNQVEAMITYLIDHYFMIIRLKKNLQGYGLNTHFEGMRCLFHDFLFGKKLVSYEYEIIF